MYIKNIFSSFLNQIAKIILKFIVSILVARTLGATKYGQITYFLLVLNLLCSYGHFGIINAISFFEKDAKSDSTRRYSSNLFFLVTICIMWFAILSSRGIRDTFFSEYSLRFFLCGFFYVLGFYIFSMNEACYISEEKLYLSNRFLLIGITIATLIIGMQYITGSISTVNYLFAITMEYSIAALLSQLFSTRKIKLVFDYSIIFREFKYGNVIFWASLLGYLMYRVDQVMIKNYMGMNYLGIYSVAVSIAELVLFIPTSFTSALTGKLLNSEENDIRISLSRTIKMCFYVTSIISLIGIVCSPLLGIIYGEEYSQGILSLQILFVGIVGASVAKVIYPYYLVKGKPKVHLMVTLLSFVSNILLNYCLIPKFGIEGAAIASSVAYIIYGGVYVLLLTVKEKIMIKDLLCLNVNELNWAKEILLSKFSKQPRH